jgi:alkylated DNA repair dioxygenase AlkB
MHKPVIEPLVDCDGHVYLIRNLWPSGKSEQYFKIFRSSCPWRQDELTVYGRKYLTPRLTSWHGDAPYTYSGVTMTPQLWTRELLEIKTEIEAITEAKFNSVLLNLYRDGRDSMGWHQDNETALGENPLIASVSLGETRRFRLRHKTGKARTISIDLPNSSLLVMSGRLQQHWQHAVPKTARDVGARINLTYRWTCPRPLRENV